MSFEIEFPIIGDEELERKVIWAENRPQRSRLLPPSRKGIFKTTPGSLSHQMRLGLIYCVCRRFAAT